MSLRPWNRDIQRERAAGRPTARLCALLCLCLAVPPLIADIRTNLEPGGYGQDQLVVFWSDNPQYSVFYRFEGVNAFRPQANGIRLSALLGESRRYLIHVEARGPKGQVDTRSFEYLIDKAPPPPPSPSLVGGIVRPGTRLSLSAPGAERIVYAFLPGQECETEYQGPIEIPGSGEAVLRSQLQAMAIDSFGNASAPLVADFVCMPPGLGLERSEEAFYLAKAQDPSIPSVSAIRLEPSVGRYDGGMRVAFPNSPNTSLQYAVLDSSEDFRPDRLLWRDARQEANSSVIDVPSPEGYAYKLGLAYRLADGTRGAATLSDPKSPRSDLNYLYGWTRVDISELAAAPIAFPPEPRLIASQGQRAAWFRADSWTGKIMFSQDDGIAREYLGPCLLRPQADRESIKLTYFFISPGGEKSPPRELSVKLPAYPGKPELIGFPELGLSSQDITLSPGPASVVLRYEMSQNGAPKAVGPGSPLLADSLRLSAAEGETRIYALRLRSFSSSDPEASASEERILSLTVDKEPPQAPLLKEMPDLSTAPDKSFGFDAGTDRVFYRIVRNGKAEGGYTEYRQAFSLKADQEALVRYALSFYSMDRAGNRSKEVLRDDISIDATAVYLSERGMDGNDGSPSFPVASLEAAIKLAFLTRRPYIKMHGTVKAKARLLVEHDLRIDGGYSEQWDSGQGGESRLELQGMELKGASLSLERLTIYQSDGQLARPWELNDAQLSISSCEGLYESSGDEAITLAQGSRLSLSDSSIRLRGRGKMSAIIAEASKIEMLSSTLEVFKAEIITAIQLEGGEFRMMDSRLLAMAGQSSAALRARGCLFQADRSLLSANADSGFAVACILDSVSTTLQASVISVRKASEALLFDVDGGSLNLSHVTAILDGVGKAANGFRLDNCLMDVRSSFFTCLSKPKKGALFSGQADSRGLQGCYQAGFPALGEGPWGEALTARVSSIPTDLGIYMDAKGLPRLRAGSPLIDACSLPEGAEGLDWYGNPRPAPRGRRLADVGAIEEQ